LRFRLARPKVEPSDCTAKNAMTVSKQKLDDWLARCRWLQTTRLDQHTRERLDRLITDLERDIEDQRDFENSYRRFG
jgi:hypothetical protein